MSTRIDRLMQMEAGRTVNGPVYLVLSHAGFDLLVGLSTETSYEMRKKADEFRERIGISRREYDSLQDEFLLIRYEVLGYKRPPDSRTGEPWGPTEVRMTNTKWGQLPKMSAEVLQDGRVRLMLSRGELGIFANAVEVALDELVPNRTRHGVSELQSRQGLAVVEAEELISKLRRLDEETSSKKYD